MHEMHLVRDIFKDLLGLAKENKAGKVTCVYLRMGEFTEINPEIVRFFFEKESAGSVIEGAKIEIEKSPTRELSLVSFDCE